MGERIEDGFFAAIAVIVLLQIIVVVSSAIGTRFRRRRTTVQLHRTPWPKLTVDANEVQIYTYGMDLYDSILHDIRQAERLVCIESFIWKGDRIGAEIKAAIVEKARQGVPVYVVFDAFANMVVDRRFKEFPSPVRVLRYRAWRRLWDVLDPRRLARDHRKLLVVDGRVGYLGGYNIGDLYGEKWRDTHVRIEGKTAQNLLLSFMDFWNEHASPEDRYPFQTTGVLQPFVRLYANNPARLMFPIRTMYIDAIDLAKERVYLTTPYFIPDRFILSSLVRAARRGVDVQLVVPEESNHLLADWLARTYFTECLKQGIRIFLYQGAMIHAKTATVDGMWTTVGTANLDRLSLVGNYELNVEFLDSGVALQMERIFLLDRQNCRELHLEEWLRRSILQKLGELVLSPLWPFL